MPTIYKIHPGIGIARLGNSPNAFCISPEEPAALPLECDARGNPLRSPDGTTELRITKFKDDEGRIKRQAARFQVWAYDEDSPQGRPLKLGDPIAGGGNRGVLVDIQWRVYLANKKAAWYEFRQLDGEHGYTPDHPRRNANLTDAEARQRLIIDPGPRLVDCKEHRHARFDRDGGGYAATFPPPLQPQSIDTLGEILTDDTGRLLVLGGHGHSGSFLSDQFGQPRIDTYANNDGWFDDTSDGPVMARLVMYSAEVGQVRFIDVEFPAWVIVGYPAYVPQILDMVTIDDVMYDLGVREFAMRTDLYGTAGTFNDPQRIDSADREALLLWQNGRLQWNPHYKPWFYRDIWTILYRADEFTYTSDVLGQSNYPHNQSPRGNFDPDKLSVPPAIDRRALEAWEQQYLAKHQSGEVFVEALMPALELLEKRAEHNGQGGGTNHVLTEEFAGALREPVAAFAREMKGVETGNDWQGSPSVGSTAETAPAAQPKAVESLEHAVEGALATVRSRLPDRVWQRLRTSTLDHLRQYQTGRLVEAARRKWLEANTYDPYRSFRQHLFDLLRQPGEENLFRLGDKASSRTHGLPLMPLLAGDNPISNTVPAKFLRLTDLQFYLLRQWARGYFYNEELEGWAKSDPWQPYKNWVNRTGLDLDRGVLSNVLGGAFCPGGEVGWIMRNPAIYREPYRLKADPDFYNFRQTAAQANANRGQVSEIDYTSAVDVELSQDNDFDKGLQPGDLTKYMALPWQSDFNECSTQDINVTYDAWNQIASESDGDTLMKREQKVWETLWWPAHRPLQTWEVASVTDGKPSYVWLDWSRGVPQTNAGDLKMVTEWWRLGFVRRNPYLPPGNVLPSELPPDQKYISVERTERREHRCDAKEDGR
jgi:hypothetical protein